MKKTSLLYKCSCHSFTRECGKQGLSLPHATCKVHLERIGDENPAAMTLNLLELYLHDLRKRALGENTENTKTEKKNL